MKKVSLETMIASRRVLRSFRVLMKAYRLARLILQDGQWRRLAAAVPILCVLVLAAAPALATEARLLMLGDSITAGFGLAPEDGLVAQLRRRLQADGVKAVLLEGGVSGDTAAGGLARLDWMLGARPSHAIVALGGNDALRGLNPAATEAALAAILDRLTAEGIPVLLAGMKAPRNLGHTYAEAFDSLYPRLAARYEVVFYPFLLEGVAADPALNQPDGIHPSAAGAAIIATRLAPYVARLLALSSKPSDG
ncbi:MAG: arylesterase [Alphaproteobacteria bacterium]|nr:arylesterase [Alphaproteobacteria bacterium]